ncbi:neurogenic differentiation factor 4-like [Scylla paramamosain]|uniref:neurogenic differentiation factor 4-like n=1 Tax=Scylla paramamosain TaxID=85552 RepID=UPI003083C628
MLTAITTITITAAAAAVPAAVPALTAKTSAPAPTTTTALTTTAALTTTVTAAAAAAAPAVVPAAQATWCRKWTRSTPGFRNSTQKPRRLVGKYQLRPRSLQARRHSDSEWSLQDTLRHKPRPQPLSRYRRKTANARERYRMRQINTAFESLRGVLPSWVCSRRAAADMTKITTLRLASAYIRSLQDILDGNAPEDTCSWVLSSILGDTTKSKGAQPEPVKTQNTPVSTQQEADFVSFLCNSSDTGVFQDNLDSLSYLSPMSETEAVALLLGSDPPRGWGDAHHTQLVT